MHLSQSLAKLVERKKDLTKQQKQASIASTDLQKQHAVLADRLRDLKAKHASLRDQLTAASKQASDPAELAAIYTEKVKKERQLKQAQTADLHKKEEMKAKLEETHK